MRAQTNKPFTLYQIVELSLLLFIVFEHAIVFLLTFKKQSPKRNLRKRNQRSIALPSKSFLYSCLHRNWIRALSFSNICLSFVYFSTLLLKHYHPNLLHHSSITFYSLTLNLLQQILINFSTFHLFIISISVFQYFLRYYRLLKNTYSSYFFNGQNFLLTKHKNVALILSSSLALIFAYNFIFYTPKHPETMTLLPLVTFNMILLPSINLIVLSFIFVCFIINYLYRSDPDDLSIDNDQENLRLIVEKNTCIKCYSKILEKNPNLFQDKNYSYRNLLEIFFSSRLQSSFGRSTQGTYFSNNKKINSQSELSSEHEKDLENNSKNNLFFQKTLNKLRQQRSLCHLCFYLLLIMLFKYTLLTSPQHILQMIFHLKQFYEFILKNNRSSSVTSSLYQENELLLTICHFLFLLSRFGDSLILIRLPYLIKKYFPCWCHFNSKLLSHKQQRLEQKLTMKTSQSLKSEQICSLDTSNIHDASNEFKQQSLINKSHWQRHQRRFRLKFRFVPLWSHTRPRIFKECV